MVPTEQKESAMHKVGDIVYKSDGRQFNCGQIVRIIGNKSMVNFNGMVVTVLTKHLITKAQIRKNRV
jgi:hypothetical protein